MLDRNLLLHTPTEEQSIETKAKQKGKTTKINHGKQNKYNYFELSTIAIYNNICSTTSILDSTVLLYFFADNMI